MTPRPHPLFVAVTAALCMAVAHADAGSGADVKPLVIKPRGSDSTASNDSMERLRQRLEEKLGAIPDPGGDRVIRVVNRVPGKAESPKKAVAAGKVREGGDVVASASMSVGHGNGAEPSAVSPAMATAVSAEGASAVSSGQSSMHRPLAAWDYHGAGSPPKWGRLDPAYGTCSTGQRQSPIDIRDGIKVALEPIRFDYKPSGFSVTDDGHTVQVDMQPGNFVSIMGRRYELVEFHFHRPAEEVVEGKRYDMVIHMLHRDAEGHMAMVAVLLDRGEVSQQVVQSIWNNLPLEKNEPLVAPGRIDPTQLLPVDQSYYTYMGSLTMPPCTEGVLWMVLRQPVSVTDEQIDIFSRLYPMNARPLQAASGRLIKQN